MKKNKQYADNLLQPGKEIEIQLMLMINDRLFAKGAITEEMYIKAKELIIAS